MRYLGNKAKLLAQIEQVVREKTGLKTGTMLDAFAGTASVARHFRSLGWVAHGSDLMAASYVQQRAHLAVAWEPRFRAGGLDRACRLLDAAVPRHGLVYRQFSDGGRAGRLYFSSLNAARIDGAWVDLVRWWRDGLIDEDAFYTLLCALIDAADRVANISGTYGAYLKQLMGNARRPLVIQPPARLSWMKPCGKAHRGDAAKVASELEVDLLYLDPPYNERQYVKYFHVPEVLASMHLQDDLDGFEARLYGKTGVSALEDRLSSFCRADEVLPAFVRLLSVAKAKHVVISYSNEGLLTQEQIVEALASTGWTGVEVVEIDYRRFKSDADDRRNYAADGVTEFLFYGRR